MHAMRIHQILNHYTSREELDPGFLVLDNSSNERPDWFEYWPMRKFLLVEPLEEDVFYGFLSPKFQLKTSLSSAAVRALIVSTDAATDVILLSPSIHNSAYFLNVFEHGDSEHPGLKRVAEQLFERLGLECDFNLLVSDSRNTVHSNFFIAKPRFWRAWLSITERMFDIAETAGDSLGKALCEPTSYRGSRRVQMKIFVMERLATWLLSTNGSFKARVRDPFVARSRIYKLPVAIVCDALKIAYATQDRGQYLDVFKWLVGLRKFLNFQICIGARLGLRPVGSLLRVLKSRWHQAEQCKDGR